LLPCSGAGGPLAFRSATPRHRATAEPPDRERAALHAQAVVAIAGRSRGSAASTIDQRLGGGAISDRWSMWRAPGAHSWAG
jgi:hypothetical protein